MKLSTILASAVIALAILLTAWNGNIDWIALALFAVVMKLPGSKLFRDVLRRISGRDQL